MLSFLKEIYFLLISFIRQCLASRHIGILFSTHQIQLEKKSGSIKKKLYYKYVLASVFLFYNHVKCLFSKYLVTIEESSLHIATQYFSKHFKFE